MKVCVDCGTEKSLEDFYGYKKRRTVTYMPRCKACHQRKTNLWRDAHRDRVNELSRIRERGTYSYGTRREELLLRRYGMTNEEYEALLAAQGSACAICRGQERRRHPKTGNTDKLHVDHDHASGAVRALLCSSCNLLIGRIESVGLAPLLAYLEPDMFTQMLGGGQG